MPKVHQQVRSYCREEARRIIDKDREARKYGLSQNTIGAIENAMIEAYKMGRAGIGDPDRLALDDAIRWDDLPPRSRSLLDWATSHRSLRQEQREEVFDDLQQLSVDGKSRWFTIKSTGLSSHSFASGAATALLKHQLIEPVAGQPDRYRISDTGKALCRDYWERSSAGDPSLPKMYIRS